jgi:hypothetical protein
MAARRKTVREEEARLLGLLLSGDIAGFEKATGMSMREMELRMRAGDEPDDDDELGYDHEDDDEFYFDEEEDDWRLRPDWLHADCVDPCTALDLGTCCKYPADPLVSRAVALADSVDRTLGQLGRGNSGNNCVAVAGDLTRLLASVPGLLAQIHAVLPGMARTSMAQLTCPVGRLDGALDLMCLHGCPWACGDPEVPDRRAEFEPLRPLLKSCSHALWAGLRSGSRRGPASSLG